jgi:hypothetical protein
MTGSTIEKDHLKAFRYESEKGITTIVESPNEVVIDRISYEMIMAEMQNKARWYFEGGNKRRS